MNLQSLWKVYESSQLECGLWDRVVFDEYGIPKVQYSDGLKYVPTTAFHWGLVQYSKWLETGDEIHFDNAIEVATCCRKSI